MKKIKLFILATLMGNLSLFSQTSGFPRISMEGVELMVAVKHGTYDYNKHIAMPKGLYAFNYDENFQPKKDQPVIRFNASGGCVLNDGKIYVCEYDYNANLQNQKPHWKVFDAATHQLLSDKEMEDNFRCTTYNLAYDRTTDKIYGLLETYTENYLVRIDPATAQVERVCELPFTNKYTCLACNKYGQLYCIYFKKEDSTHYLAKIRKSDGKVANIGEMTVDNLLHNDIFINFGYSQDIFFNNSNDKLYWILQSSTQNLVHNEYTAIIDVDTNTGAASLTAYVVDPIMVNGAFFMEPEFSAPRIIENFNYVSESDNHIRGHLEFRLPTLDYVGNAIDGQLSYVVKENGTTKFEGNAMPGTVVKTNAAEFAQGEHQVTVTVANSAGEEGPTVKRSFFSGYDKPKACRNITLTAEGLTTKLTWDAPDGGVHGAPINPAGFTYTVIRYPFEVTVATGLKTCEFVEQHPEDMTRYVYIVKAVDASGQEGVSAFSNNLIVGKPLEIPFESIFESPAELLNYYTIVDANKDGNSWSYDLAAQSPIYIYSDTKKADDWLITPPANFRKNRKYTLTFKAWSGFMASESMEVWVGKGRTPETLDQMILSIPAVPHIENDVSQIIHRANFTTNSDSIFHVGFRVTSPARSGSLYINEIRIEEITSGIDTFANDNTEGLVDVYGVNGVMLHHAVLPAVVDRLSAGVYILRSLSKTYKVIISK
ncbi:hypothetical protein [Prevotella sp. OH937_COT-195]|uniref:hypothetical protein n=1 Tax=Prevotella sp. OH937_COT-195 TaxID=2491051 RepID=UPI000F64C2C2|nr:hypothetical protein [Prevotella sp. OH937_COT-195]RRC99441.1 hypothetical protein EII32_07930 [Prevotella sp. OH937_COT-195]